MGPTIQLNDFNILFTKHDTIVENFFFCGNNLGHNFFLKEKLGQRYWSRQQSGMRVWPVTGTEAKPRPRHH